MEKLKQQSGKQNTKWNKIPWLIGTTVFFIGVFIIAMLAVPVTIYQQPNNGGLHPADAITSKTNVQQCINGDFENISSIEFLFGTFSRQNNSQLKLEIYEFTQEKQKKTLYQSSINTAILSDNTYHAFALPQVDVKEKFCYKLDSADATSGNAVTVWLNHESDPVLKLKSILPLPKLIEKITQENPFGLNIIIVTTLGIFALISYLGSFSLLKNEPEQSPITIGTRKK